MQSQLGLFMAVSRSLGEQVRFLSAKAKHYPNHVIRWGGYHPPHDHNDDKYRTPQGRPVESMGGDYGECEVWATLGRRQPNCARLV